MLYDCQELLSREFFKSSPAFFLSQSLHLSFAVAFYCISRVSKYTTAADALIIDSGNDKCPPISLIRQTSKAIVRP